MVHDQKEKDLHIHLHKSEYQKDVIEIKGKECYGSISRSRKKGKKTRNTLRTKKI